jgi:hypothetical protein
VSRGYESRTTRSTPATKVSSAATLLLGDGVVDAEFVALERVEDGGARASAVREETVGVARRVLTGDGGVVHEHRSWVEGCALE